jgi:hypothetical protein
MGNKDGQLAEAARPEFVAIQLDPKIWYYFH